MFIVRDKPPNSVPDSSTLRLDLALQLLEQSGYPLPSVHVVGRGAWLQAVVDALCELSSQDPLTGLANRRHFELALDREIDRVARAGEPALVLMIDIDHFKRVNDSFGHTVGDVVLKSVAHVLQGCIRPMDTVARIGGEEFAIILPNCPLDFGLTAAERVRNKVQNRSVLVSSGQEVSVTVSIGGAYAPQWARIPAQQWLSRADRQLYLAKSEGRNRARLEAPPNLPADLEGRPPLFDSSWFHEPK
jgi:diguanylate cyclase